MWEGECWKCPTGSTGCPLHDKVPSMIGGAMPLMNPRWNTVSKSKYDFFFNFQWFSRSKFKAIKNMTFLKVCLAICDDSVSVVVEVKEVSLLLSVCTKKAVIAALLGLCLTFCAFHSNPVALYCSFTNHPKAEDVMIQLTMFLISYFLAELVTLKPSILKFAIPHYQWVHSRMWQRRATTFLVMTPQRYRQMRPY